MTTIMTLTLAWVHNDIGGDNSEEEEEEEEELAQGQVSNCGSLHPAPAVTQVIQDVQGVYKTSSFQMGRQYLFT